MNSLAFAVSVAVSVLAAQTAADPGPGQQPPDAPIAEPALTPPPVVEPPAPSQGFIKGELSVYLGSDRLVVKHTRVGLSVGLDQFDNIYFALAEPLLDLRFLDAKLGFGFGVPLRFELLNFNNDASGQPIFIKRIGRLRTEDWDSLHDFGRVLKYVTYGRKEDPLYISAGQRYASSLGHGAIMRRYAPNVDINYPRASAQVDAYNEYGGFELFTNDLLEWNTLGALAFIKPFGFTTVDNLMAKSLSIGVTAATDWKAPNELQNDPTTGLRLLDSDGRLITSTKPVGLIGFDAEFKVVKTEHVDIKPYVDYSMFLGGDGGFTVGALGRFNVGQDIVNAFRVVAEFRYLGNRYIPSYFDTFYETERFVATELPRINPDVVRFGTKQQATMRGYGQRAGYYIEGSWGIPGKVGVTLAAEGVSNSPATNLVAHVEVPVLDFLQVFGSYYKRGMTKAGDIVSLDLNTIFFAGARLKLLPFLFLNGRAYKMFRMNRDLQRYENQLGFVVDLEIGYEFRPKTKDDDEPKRDDAPKPSDGEAVTLRGR